MYTKTRKGVQQFSEWCTYGFKKVYTLPKKGVQQTEKRCTLYFKKVYTFYILSSARQTIYEHSLDHL